MMIYEIDPSIPTLESLRTSPSLAAAADHEYETTRSGIRTTLPSSVAYFPFSHYLPPTTLSQTISSLPPSTPETDPRRHDREAILRRRFTHDQQNLGQIEFNFDLSNYSAHYPSRPGKKYATMLQMLQYPFSTGCIHISPSSRGRGKPTTVDEKPLIDPKYYEGEGGAVDLEMMSRAQRFADRIVRTAPLSGIIVKRVWPPEASSSSSSATSSPSPSSSPPDDPTTGAAATSARETSSHQVTIDHHQQHQETHAVPNTTTNTINNNEEKEEEDFTPFVRATTVTDWHPVGTCAMGGASARDGSVLDPRLRVRGVQGLRVVDASVMPLQISAHLQATVYAVAEKGAAMIAEDWGGG